MYLDHTSTYLPDNIYYVKLWIIQDGSRIGVEILVFHPCGFDDVRIMFGVHFTKPR